MPKATLKQVKYIKYLEFQCGYMKRSSSRHKNITKERADTYIKRLLDTLSKKKPEPSDPPKNVTRIFIPNLKDL